MLPWKRQKQYTAGRYINGNSGIKERERRIGKERNNNLTHFLGHCQLLFVLTQGFFEQSQ